MVARTKEDDATVPPPRARHFSSPRTEKGRQYPIYGRKLLSLDAPEEVTLDLNRLAEGHAFVAIGASTVSDDGRLLAYTVDFTGFREYTLHVKDLETGGLLAERIEKVAAVAWTADPTTFFYVAEDPAKRPHRLWRHRLGAAADDL